MHKVKILSAEKIGNLTKLIVEKPDKYRFFSGQAAEISINKEGLEKESRPFTFISTPQDDRLEFMIKSYSGGLTEKFSKLEAGDELIISEPFGTIWFRGKGLFIAGGTGVNPFISILRNLHGENKLGGNKLIFSSKTQADIIMESELRSLLGNNVEFTLTRERKDGYRYGRIDKKFLQDRIENFSQHFYVCGPIQFVVDVKRALDELGVKPESVILEL